MAIAPVLHVPDEPVARAEEWSDEILVEGHDLDVVLRGPDGLVPWLWSRWRSLAAVGMSEEALERVVLDYRREVWLWLAGERTWAQCCSGLIGRINRRLVTSDQPGG